MGVGTITKIEEKYMVNNVHTNFAITAIGTGLLEFTKYVAAVDPNFCYDGKGNDVCPSFIDGPDSHSFNAPLKISYLPVVALILNLHATQR